MKDKRILYGMIIFICLLLVFFTGHYLFKTEAGTQTVFKLVAKKMAPNLSYDRVTGKILGEIEITNLKYHSEEFDITIRHLTAKNSFNVIFLKLINQALLVEDAIITPHYLHLSEKNKNKDSHVPIKIEANKILLKNVSIKNGQNNAIQLPNLIASLNLTPRILSVLVFKQDDESFFVQFHQQKNTLSLDLHVPYYKTDWKLHLSSRKKAYLLNAEINDSHHGSVILHGKTEGTTQGFLYMGANNLHLNDLWPNYWPGVINLSFVGQHHKNATQLQLQSLKGMIDHQPIEGKGELILKNKKLSKLYFSLASQNANILVTQNQSLQNQIDWILRIPKLNNFVPKINGDLFGKGIIEHINSKPKIKGNVVVNKFAFQKIKINTLALSAEGNLKYHHIKMALNGSEQKSSIQLRGKYDNSKWHAKLDQLSIDNAKQKWILDHPASIALSKESLLISSLRLRANQSNISLTIHYPFALGPTGEVDIRNLDLSLFNDLLPENSALEGKINLKASANARHKQTLNLTAQLSPGSFYYRMHNEPHKNIYNGGKFLAHFENNSLETNLSLNFPEGEITSNIKMPRFNVRDNIKNQKLEGKLNVQLNQIKFLELLIPAIKNVTGMIQGKYNVTGTLQKPNINGELNLVRGMFEIPKLNLKVNNVHLNAKNDKADVAYQGSLSSGNGTLEVKGNSHLTKDSAPIELDLKGSNLLVCNQPEIKILANPDLHLTLKESALKLSGKIFVPEANIHPHDFGSTESASDDIIFIQEDGKKIESNSLKIISSIHLTLGNKIYLSSNGIKGQVLGQIQIEDDPNKATIATGQLWLQDGNYSIYGKTLQIDDGRLIFSGGPIHNPGLNIKASRSLQVRTNSLFAAEENIKVGVKVVGTLSEPKINLFSEPAGKSSADILSYLILGMPLNSVNQAEGKSNTQLLLQAADSLNISGNSKLLNIKDQLKKGLGLSELDIGTQSEIDPHTQETIQHTAFVLGKYLSPKFYVSYSLDLFDHTNTFKVRYLMNKFWTVQSVANTNGSGVDILYTVEK